MAAVVGINKNLGYYSKFTEFPMILKTGLDNRRPEANFPLIKVVKKYLAIDMKEKINEELKSRIIALAKNIDPNSLPELTLLRSEAPVSPKVLKLLFKKIVPLLDGKSKNQSDWYFQFVKDSYAKEIVDLFLADDKRREQVVEGLQKWAEEGVAEKLLKKIQVEQYSRDQAAVVEFNETIKIIVKAVSRPDDQAFSLQQALEALTASLLVAGSPQLQATLSRLLISQKEMETELQITDEKKHTINKRIKVKINNKLMAFIKRRQYEEINHYDGLLEHVVPMTLRGLNGSVEKKTVEKIALEGDYSSTQDLFNHEVNSRARASFYARGHTGKSNRSSTVANKIAAYFATGHGFRYGIADVPTLWFTIYESQKGLMMSEIEPEGGWKEGEIVTPYLKPERFLGAVQFTVDRSSVPQEGQIGPIRLIPVDGFASKKVIEGNYRKEGEVGEIAKLLRVAKAFARTDDEQKKGELKDFFAKNEGEGDYYIMKSPCYYESFPLQPITEEESKKFRKEELLPYQKKISEYDSDYLKELLPKPLPAKNFLYKLARVPMRFRAKIETDEEKRSRFVAEKKRLRELTEKYGEKIPSVSELLLIQPSIALDSSAIVSGAMASAPIAVRNEIDFATAQQGLRHFIQFCYNKKFPHPKERQCKAAPFYSTKIRGDYEQYLETVEKTKVTRAIHGAMHASRTALWVLVLGRLCQKKHIEIKDEEIYNAILSAGSHDGGREDEGKDYWDEASAKILLAYLEVHTPLPKEKREELYNSVAHKDAGKIFEKTLPETCLLHDGDALEILRTGRFKFSRKDKEKKREEFNLSELIIFNRLEKIMSKEELVALFKEIRSFIWLTDTEHYKQQIEMEEKPLSYLMLLLSANKVKFPMINYLLKGDFTR